jgi:hypothetical protein
LSHEPTWLLFVLNLALCPITVSVRPVHLDEEWVDVEDGPKWTPTEVSTWGINGHFGAGSC